MTILSYVHGGAANPGGCNQSVPSTLKPTSLFGGLAIPQLSATIIPPTFSIHSQGKIRLSRVVV